MNNRPQLVYLAFGAEIYQLEAIFSLVSALSRSSTRGWDIQVFTDAPERYVGLPVKTQIIDEQWAGPHRYHFRIKHAVLREVLRHHEIAALVDTDTFFHHCVDDLFTRIRPGHLLCNSIGQRLIDSDHPQTFKDAIARQGLLSQSLRQTNSGVIGLHKTDAHILEHSIRLMDELHEEAGEVYTFEEICLALAAHEKVRLRECPDLLHHYWSRKAQFRAKIMAWHDKHGQAPLSSQALKDSTSIKAHLPRPPLPLRSLQKFFTLAAPAEQRQFMREVLYGCYRYPNEFDRACSAVWWEKALENTERRLSRRLDAATLNLWLNQPILRTLAGQFHQDLKQHLGNLRATAMNSDA
ncbi:hypothetical protein OU800_02740 [Pseudomonas sp. GOM7]|uniref:hypothetical protein n=1 Tax=Pseudomonas sp. GOM7 TaxID=2998079 RepID=UPI00227CDF06|nr:hypothetical protein [Pseudomonas sp. GOM7]WAJ38172.1 hypothetical protein OU800_02740 [Pseudomonas sp. GOM7]